MGGLADLKLASSFVRFLYMSFLFFLPQLNFSQRHFQVVVKRRRSGLRPAPTFYGVKDPTSNSTFPAPSPILLPPLRAELSEQEKKKKMYFLSHNRPVSPTTRLASLLVVSTFILQSLAASSNSDVVAFSPPHHALLRRDEDVGSSCDSEGQWNCMTDSWQRCASGEWSSVIQCADRTKCEPSGHTMEFRIEWNNGSDSDSGSNSSDAPSLGQRASPNHVMGLAVFWVCALVAAI
jgi:hypothetical protein